MKLSENAKKFVEPIIKTCEAQFPKKCANCGREYSSFKEFVRLTKVKGSPQYSSEINDPFGLISYADCQCGSTLVLKCADERMHELFMKMIDSESAKTGCLKKEILMSIRDEVRSKAVI